MIYTVSLPVLAGALTFRDLTDLPLQNFNIAKIHLAFLSISNVWCKLC